MLRFVFSFKRQLSCMPITSKSHWKLFIYNVFPSISFSVLHCPGYCWAKAWYSQDRSSVCHTALFCVCCLKCHFNDKCAEFHSAVYVSHHPTLLMKRLHLISFRWCVQHHPNRPKHPSPLSQNKLAWKLVGCILHHGKQALNNAALFPLMAAASLRDPPPPQQARWAFCPDTHRIKEWGDL